MLDIYIHTYICRYTCVYPIKAILKIEHGSLVCNGISKISIPKKVVVLANAFSYMYVLSTHVTGGWWGAVG